MPVTKRDHPSLKFPVTLFKSNSYPSIEGSSTGSSPPNDLGSTHPSRNTSPFKESYHGKKQEEQDKKWALCSACNSPQYLQGSAMLYWRNARTTKLLALSLTVHFLISFLISFAQMDMSSIVGDAIDYIQELQKAVEMYQDELRDNEEENINRYNPKQDVSKLGWKCKGRSNQPTTELNDNPSTSTADDKGKATVEIEVNQIGATVFLVRIICKQRQDGFLRLMQAMDSSGLQVIDVNVTTSNGVVLNILIVEANRKEIRPNALKDSLFKLLC